MKNTYIAIFAFSLSLRTYAMNPKGAQALATMKVLTSQASDLINESWKIANNSSLPFYAKKVFIGQYNIGLLTKADDIIADTERAIDEILDRQKFWFFNPKSFEDINPSEKLNCKFAVEQKTKDLVKVLTHSWNQDEMMENYKVNCGCNFCPHSREKSSNKNVYY